MTIALPDPSNGVPLSQNWFSPWGDTHKLTCGTVTDQSPVRLGTYGIPWNFMEVNGISMEFTGFPLETSESQPMHAAPGALRLGEAE